MQEETSFRFTATHKAVLKALALAAKREREETQKQAEQQEQTAPQDNQKGAA